jgi:diguanylate cyclase (GGDEF)-like protein
VNDSFGHPVGDEVLRAVARRITRKMRASDHFARWGGSGWSSPRH